ncbi:extracellular matrix-binding ebh, putative [Babesia caballi]|uniref:Extracellular matrix-binding ebh, putative n=1 Tax=Babesia caballi TaxID=5871 RepID=A0AAV4LYK7_BABCB|nr:extracellular matrix-binding ebh, putative [Babesia caballi]
MGFQSTDLRSSGSGHYISIALQSYCGYPTSPLRQLSEKLSCLTKRTPRTLGDVFGFYLQLVGQLFENRYTFVTLTTSMPAYSNLSTQSHKFVIDPSSVIKTIYKMIEKLSYTPQSLSPSGLENSLLVLTKNLPFWFQLFMVDGSKELPGTLFDLRQHCHNLKQNDTSKHYDPSGQSCAHTTGHAADLWSLYYPQCTGQNSCGQYLYPLTMSDGSTFAPRYAVTYLSWVLYLADDLQFEFQDILDEFDTIQCTTSRTHAPSSRCDCGSVVQCSGILPMLYRHGFDFFNAYSLNGWNSERTGWKSNTTLKRSCANFHSQLSNVLSEGAPLHSLLLVIDDFLYLFRFYFFYNLSSFWVCPLAILLYFIFYGIDVLHLKSHVHFPSTHNVPPIGLLTSGNAQALTKLTYYMP